MRGGGDGGDGGARLSREMSEEGRVVVDMSIEARLIRKETIQCSNDQRIGDEMM